MQSSPVQRQDARRNFGSRKNRFSVDSLICCTSPKRMWFFTSATICSVSSLENRSRRRIASAMRTPTSTCPLKRIRSPASSDHGGRNVAGLPMSCSSAPHASVGEHPGRQLLQQQHRVHPHIALQDETPAAAPPRASSPPPAAPAAAARLIQHFESARRACPSVSIRVSSSRMRSRLTCLISARQRPDRRSRRALDRRTPAAPQTAPPAASAACPRQTRIRAPRSRAPRPPRQVLAPTDIIQHRRVASPGSSRCSGSSSIPLIVKSRRSTSSRGSVENLHRIRPPPIAVRAVMPKRRHLGGNLPPVHRRRTHQHHAKVRPHRNTSSQTAPSPHPASRSSPRRSPSARRPAADRARTHRRSTPDARSAQRAPQSRRAATYFAFSPHCLVITSPMIERC